MAAGLRTTPAALLEVPHGDVEVVNRELAALIKDRPPRELSSLLSLLRAALTYWDTEAGSHNKKKSRRR
jgi:hypothetical protein